MSENGNWKQFPFFCRKKKVLTKSARCGIPQRSAFVNISALTNFFQIFLTYFDMVIFPKKYQIPHSTIDINLFHILELLSNRVERNFLTFLKKYIIIYI